MRVGDFALRVFFPDDTIEIVRHCCRMGFWHAEEIEKGFLQYEKEGFEYEQAPFSSGFIVHSADGNTSVRGASGMLYIEAETPGSEQLESLYYLILFRHDGNPEDAYTAYIDFRRALLENPTASVVSIVIP